jgi:hypothetical protein
MRSSLRTALAVTVLGSVALAGGAVAAPTKAAPVCNLITDPAGDTTGPSTALDIVSGDVASNGKTLTAVIRLAALAESDVSSPTGIAWGMRLTAPKSELPYYLLATKFQGSDVEFTYGQVDGTSLVELGVGTGVVDVATKEVRIHAPVKALGLKPGTTLTNLTAQGRRAIGNPNAATLYTNADSSDPATAKSYTTNAPSCVKPGA